jgi:hypothetical protein
MYTVKKEYDVFVVVDEQGNEYEECPTRKDALGFASVRNKNQTYEQAEFDLYNETVGSIHGE